MKKILVTGLLSLFVPCLCAAQTTVVDVKDESTVKCPVRMSGTIELTESETEGLHRTTFVSAVTATNLSNLPIIAIVTSTTIGNSLGPLVIQNQLLDAYFSHDKEIAPGQTSIHKHDDTGTFSDPIPKYNQRVAPVASSKVIFVQFSDGSTCGDANDGRVQTLMEARADLFQAIKKIDDAAKIGESEFVKALADHYTDRTGNVEGIIGSISGMQKEKGSPAAIARIHNMLDVAATR